VKKGEHDNHSYAGEEQIAPLQFAYAKSGEQIEKRQHWQGISSNRECLEGENSDDIRTKKDK